MEINRKVRPARLPIFLLSALHMLLLAAGCASLRQPAQQSDGDFYRSCSKKLGVSLEGTEDKSLLAASIGWLGVPYRYGGQSRKGIDCSALVGSIYREAYGMALPRSTGAIAKQAKRIKKSQLSCGDLLFFTIKDKRASHVGIYLAKGKFLHASTSKGVSVADLSNAYWSKYFSAAGRVRTPSPPAAKSRPPAKQTPPAAEKKKKNDKKKNTAAKPKPPKKEASNPEEDNGNDVIIVFDEEF